MNYNRLSIFHPSMLLGERPEFRLGELIGKILMRGLFFIFSGPLKKYRAIKARDVARAMLNAAMKPGQGVQIFAGNALFALAGKK
jgi:hypothetical protein